MSESGDEDTDDIVDMFSLQRRFCNKISGPGVTNYIAEEKKMRNESSMELTVGDWIVIDSDDEGEPLWLGRIMSNSDWGGQGVYKNTTTRIKTYDNVTVLHWNDVGIYVMWYEKIDLSSDDLDYHVSRTITKPTVQNNEYVVCSGFQMHRVVGSSNPVPRRQKAIGRSNERNYNDWHDREFGVVWKMDDKIRSRALSKCGMWR